LRPACLKKKKKKKEVGVNIDTRWDMRGLNKKKA
jgi:hypothetical protein